MEDKKPKPNSKKANMNIDFFFLLFDQAPFYVPNSLSFFDFTEIFKKN